MNATQLDLAVEEYNDERSIDLLQAQQMIFGRNKTDDGKRLPVAMDVLRRYCTAGCKTASGVLLKLKTVKEAGMRRTMLSWVHAFLEERRRLNSLEPVATVVPVTTRKQTARDRAADRTLDKYATAGR